MDEPKLQVVKVPMLDTGLGREAGYKDDAELIEAARKQRAALSPEVRELMDEVDRQFEQRFLFGESA